MRILRDFNLNPTELNQLHNEQSSKIFQTCMIFFFSLNWFAEDISHCLISIDLSLYRILIEIFDILNQVRENHIQPREGDYGQLKTNWHLTDSIGELYVSFTRSFTYDNIARVRRDDEKWKIDINATAVLVSLAGQSHTEYHKIAYYFESCFHMKLASSLHRPLIVKWRKVRRRKKKFMFHFSRHVEQLARECTNCV